MPPALSELRATVRHLAGDFSGASAVEVLDLATGMRASFDANRSMPAASTIKIPVMVEVFRDLEAGRFDLDKQVTLLARDRDWGSGDLCDAPVGSSYSVGDLLEKMIDVSDNTASNMLIRLVGRASINAAMRGYGLHHTRLTDDIRTEGYAIRTELRTSPDDLVRLLSLMARRKLVDEWSSNEMISILEGQEINTLIPEPLPEDVTIAHKTGSLHDTLNDAGIVYADDASYVIAVMTTHLPSLGIGRTFIRSISLAAYSQETAFAQWRDETGYVPDPKWASALPANAPDIRYWASRAADEGIGTGG